MYGRAGVLRGAGTGAGRAATAGAAGCGVCAAFAPRAPMLLVRMPHGLRLRPRKGRKARAIARDCFINVLSSGALCRLRCPGAQEAPIARGGTVRFVCDACGPASMFGRRGGAL